MAEHTANFDPRRTPVERVKRAKFAVCVALVLHELHKKRKYARIYMSLFSQIGSKRKRKAVLR